MSRREAVRLARRELRGDLAGGRSPVGSAPDPAQRRYTPPAGRRLDRSRQFWEVTFAGRTAHLKATRRA